MVKSAGIPVAKISVKEQNEKLSTHNHDPQTKKLIQAKNAIIFIDITNKRNAVYHLLILSWRKKRAPVRRHICIPKR